MRFSIFKDSGNLSGGFVVPGMTLTGPLLLSGVVSDPSFAVHKQYVDEILLNLNADNFTAGTIPANRMPAITGDVTAGQGSTTLTLANSGVIAGTYTKVGVNSKGIITSGGNLSEGDIPLLDWNKITIGKPTTLSGYGITDGVNKTNGVVTGSLVLNSGPTLPEHVATKAYVDQNVQGGLSYAVGEVISRSSATAVTGFLRLNGAELSKTTYVDLYAIVGNGNVFALQPGAGQPWRQQYQINLTQSADITGWTTGTALPITLVNSLAVVTKDRVYLLGGWNGSAGTTNTYTAPINADGTLGTWTSEAALPAAYYGCQVVVTKNYVYLIANTNGSLPLTTTYKAPINADGTLGTWTTGTNLSVAVRYSQTVITSNKVFILGGNGNAGNINTILTATINADGTLGTWSNSGTTPASLSFAATAVIKDYVYLFGGNNGTNAVSTVYKAPINSDGTIGTWSAGTSLPGILQQSSIIVTKNTVYLLGGRNDSSSVSTVYKATINADGTLGSWSVGTSLPGILQASQSIVTKNHVYTLGGHNGTSALSTVYMATILEGLNDYSSYYNGTFTYTDPANFKLPDFSAYENTSTYYFVKY